MPEIALLIIRESIFFLAMLLPVDCRFSESLRLIESEAVSPCHFDMTKNEMTILPDSVPGGYEDMATLTPLRRRFTAACRRGIAALP